MPGVNPPRVPEGLRDLMKSLTKEVLREKPPNVYEFSAQYFEAILDEKRDFTVKEFEPPANYENFQYRERNQIPLSLVYTIIPEGLTELIKEFIKVVLRANPSNICEFAVEYFRKLRKDKKVDTVQYTAYENYFKSKDRFSFTPYLKCTCGRKIGDGMIQEHYETKTEVSVVSSSVNGKSDSNGISRGNNFLTCTGEKECSGLENGVKKLNLINEPDFKSDTSTAELSNSKPITTIEDSEKYIHAIFVIQRFLRKCLLKKANATDLKEPNSSAGDTMTEEAAALVIQRSLRKLFDGKFQKRTALKTTPIVPKLENLTHNEDAGDNVSEAASYTSASTALMSAESVGENSEISMANYDEGILHKTIMEDEEVENDYSNSSNEYAKTNETRKPLYNSTNALRSESNTKEQNDFKEEVVNDRCADVSTKDDDQNFEQSMNIQNASTIESNNNSSDVSLELTQSTPESKINETIINKRYTKLQTVADPKEIVNSNENIENVTTMNDQSKQLLFGNELQSLKITSTPVETPDSEINEQIVNRTSLNTQTVAAAVKILDNLNENNEKVAPQTGETTSTSEENVKRNDITSAALITTEKKYNSQITSPYSEAENFLSLQSTSPEKSTVINSTNLETIEDEHNLNIDSEVTPQKSETDISLNTESISTTMKSDKGNDINDAVLHTIEDEHNLKLDSEFTPQKSETDISLNTENTSTVKKSDKGNDMNDAVAHTFEDEHNFKLDSEFTPQKSETDISLNTENISTTVKSDKGNVINNAVLHTIEDEHNLKLDPEFTPQKYETDISLNTESTSTIKKSDKGNNIIDAVAHTFEDEHKLDAEFTTQKSATDISLNTENTSTTRKSDKGNEINNAVLHTVKGLSNLNNLEVTPLVSKTNVLLNTENTSNEPILVNTIQNVQTESLLKESAIPNESNINENEESTLSEKSPNEQTFSSLQETDNKKELTSDVLNNTKNSKNMIEYNLNAQAQNDAISELNENSLKNQTDDAIKNLVKSDVSDIDVLSPTVQPDALILENNLLPDQNVSVLKDGKLNKNNLSTSTSKNQTDEPSLENKSIDNATVGSNKLNIEVTEILEVKSVNDQLATAPKDGKNGLKITTSNNYDKSNESQSNITLTDPILDDEKQHKNTAQDNNVSSSSVSSFKDDAIKDSAVKNQTDELILNKSMHDENKSNPSVDQKTNKSYSDVPALKSDYIHASILEHDQNLSDHGDSIKSKDVAFGNPTENNQTLTSTLKNKTIPDQNSNKTDLEISTLKSHGENVKLVSDQNARDGINSNEILESPALPNNQKEELILEDKPHYHENSSTIKNDGSSNVIASNVLLPNSDSNKGILEEKSFNKQQTHAPKEGDSIETHSEVLDQTFEPHLENESIDGQNGIEAQREKRLSVQDESPSVPDHQDSETINKSDLKTLSLNDQINKLNSKDKTQHDQNTSLINNLNEPNNDKGEAISEFKDLSDKNSPIPKDSDNPSEPDPELQTITQTDTDLSEDKIPMTVDKSELVPTDEQSLNGETVLKQNSNQINLKEYTLENQADKPILEDETVSNQNTSALKDDKLTLEDNFSNLEDGANANMLSSEVLQLNKQSSEPILEVQIIQDTNSLNLIDGANTNDTNSHVGQINELILEPKSLLDKNDNATDVEGNMMEAHSKILATLEDKTLNNPTLKDDGNTIDYTAIKPALANQPDIFDVAILHNAAMKIQKYFREYSNRKAQMNTQIEYSNEQNRPIDSLNTIQNDENSDNFIQDNFATKHNNIQNVPISEVSDNISQDEIRSIKSNKSSSELNDEEIKKEGTLEDNSIHIGTPNVLTSEVSEEKPDDQNDSIKTSMSSSELNEGKMNRSLNSSNTIEKDTSENNIIQNRNDLAPKPNAPIFKVTENKLDVQNEFNETNMDLVHRDDLSAGVDVNQKETGTKIGDNDIGILTSDYIIGTQNSHESINEIDNSEKSSNNNKSNLRKENSTTKHDSTGRFLPIAEIHLKSFKLSDSMEALPWYEAMTIVNKNGTESNDPPLMQEPLKIDTKTSVSSNDLKKYDIFYQESDPEFSDSLNDTNFERDSLEIASSSKETDIDEDSLELEQSSNNEVNNLNSEKERSATYLYGIHIPRQTPTQQRKTCKSPTSFTIPFNDDITIQSNIKDNTSEHVDEKNNSKANNKFNLGKRKDLDVSKILDTEVQLDMETPTKLFNELNAFDLNHGEDIQYSMDAAYAAEEKMHLKDNLHPEKIKPHGDISESLEIVQNFDETTLAVPQESLLHTIEEDLNESITPRPDHNNDSLKDLITKDITSHLIKQIIPSESEDALENISVSENDSELTSSWTCSKDLDETFLSDEYLDENDEDTTYYRNKRSTPTDVTDGDAKGGIYEIDTNQIKLEDSKYKEGSDDETLKEKSPPLLKSNLKSIDSNEDSKEVYNNSDNKNIVEHQSDANDKGQNTGMETKSNIADQLITQILTSEEKIINSDKSKNIINYQPNILHSIETENDNSDKSENVMDEHHINLEGKDDKNNDLNESLTFLNKRLSNAEKLIEKSVSQELSKNNDLKLIEDTIVDLKNSTIQLSEFENFMAKAPTPPQHDPEKYYIENIKSPNQDENMEIYDAAILNNAAIQIQKYFRHYLNTKKSKNANLTKTTSKDITTELDLSNKKNEPLSSDIKKPGLVMKSERQFSDADFPYGSLDTYEYLNIYDVTILNNAAKKIQKYFRVYLNRKENNIKASTDLINSGKRQFNNEETSDNCKNENTSELSKNSDIMKELQNVEEVSDLADLNTNFEEPCIKKTISSNNLEQQVVNNLQDQDPAIFNSNNNMNIHTSNHSEIPDIVMDLSNLEQDSNKSSVSNEKLEVSYKKESVSSNNLEKLTVNTLQDEGLTTGYSNTNDIRLEKAAIIIQKYLRGYSTRKHINNGQSKISGFPKNTTDLKNDKNELKNLKENTKYLGYRDTINGITKNSNSEHDSKHLNEHTQSLPDQNETNDNAKNLAASIIQNAFRNYVNRRPGKGDNKTSTDNSWDESQITEIYVGNNSNNEDSKSRASLDININADNDIVNENFELSVKPNSLYFEPTAPEEHEIVDEEKQQAVKVNWFVGNEPILSTVKSENIAESMDTINLVTTPEVDASSSNINACDSNLNTTSTAPLISPNINSIATVKVDSTSSSFENDDNLHNDDDSSIEPLNNFAEIVSAVESDNVEVKSANSLSKEEPVNEGQEDTISESNITKNIQQATSEEFNLPSKEILSSSNITRSNSEDDNLKVTDPLPEVNSKFSNASEKKELKEQDIKEIAKTSLEQRQNTTELENANSKICNEAQEEFPIISNVEDVNILKTISNFIDAERSFSEEVSNEDNSNNLQISNISEEIVSVEMLKPNIVMDLINSEKDVDSDIPYEKLEEPCIKKSVSLTHLDESTLNKIEGNNFDSKSQEDTESTDSPDDTLDAVTEKLRETEGVIEKMQQRRASETKSVSVEEKTAKVSSFEEPVIRSMRELQTKSPPDLTDDDAVVLSRLQREDTRESSAQSDSVVFGEENNDKEDDAEEDFDESPIVRASLKRLHTIAGDDPRMLFKSVTIDDTIKYIEPPESETTATSGSSFCLDDDTSENIRQKMMAYSLSEADSDLFVSIDKTKANLDDFNISTALLDTGGTSTDTESTIVSAATKIQAGARGFITRTRLRRASAGTNTFVQDEKASFGNDAISESLEKLIEYEAAKKIQRAYRKHYWQKKAAPGASEDEDFHSTSLAARRQTLQRGDALRNDSAPDDENGNGKYVVQEKSTPVELDLDVSEAAKLITTEALPVSRVATKEPNTKKVIYNKLKWPALRQNSMPVQIDCEVFRVIPKHMRKRIKSAEGVQKGRRIIFKD